MNPEDDQPAVDSALNGDEPSAAQETSLAAEPNGAEESKTLATEAPATEEPQEEAKASTEDVAEPEPAAPEVATAPETSAPPEEEEPSGIAAEFERALQAAAEPEPEAAPAEAEPEPAAEVEPPAAEPEPEPEEPAPVAEAPAMESVGIPVVDASPNGDSAAAEAEALESEGEEDESLARAFQPGDWFVVHTYAGYENKVKTNLESRISSMNVEEKIFEVVIPMEDVMEIKSGKKQVVQRKVFPGYLLVRMDLDDDSWYVVRNTPGVTGFVGSGARPIPLSEKEVDRILQRKPVGERPKPKLEWSVNDPVRVTTGPFANFQGLISEIDTDRSKLKVLVNIFGRETPVELGFDQVAKV
jgi:transcriptional antiterminator NusG